MTDRGFTVDSLNRLTDTTYFGSGETESSALDLVGNREQHIDRLGETVDYALQNWCNEYAAIDGQPVEYDPAGNLITDEAGRHYYYDEHNRLTQVRAANDLTVLANYAYDSLGRRITFQPDPPTGPLTRYYYDGQRVIEERNGLDQLLKYHVNGAQYIDERIATFFPLPPPPGGGGGGGLSIPEPAVEHFSYYLAGQNFSVTGVGSADGAVIERLEYSATGAPAGPPQGFFFDADSDGDIQGGDVDTNDAAGLAACFSGSGFAYDPGCALHDFDRDGDVDLADWRWFQHFATEGPDPAPPAASRSGSYAHDADGDRDVDLDDFAVFVNCWNPRADGSYVASCLAAHDFDGSGAANGVLNQEDEAGFDLCDDNGPGVLPPDACFRPAPEGSAPSQGDFAMHGRPVDVLEDGNLVLGDFRARLYDVKNGRWLQRDPKGYVDGGNLYEAFNGNPLSNTDATGADSITDLGDTLYYQASSGDQLFSWHFAQVLGPDNVLVDAPNFPFAFIIGRGAALESFNTGPMQDDFFSVTDILSKATQLAIEEGGRFPARPQGHQVVRFVLDKTSATPKWVSPNEFYDGLYQGAESANLGVAISRDVLLSQVHGIGDFTATSFTVTTGLLSAPAGLGATAADVIAVGADAASGQLSIGKGTVVVTAVAAGALFAGGNRIVRGGARPGRIGAEAEEAVSRSIGIARNVGPGRATIPSATGAVRFRVPDFGPEATIERFGAIIEVKNVTRLYYSRQLEDLIAEARR